MRKLKARSSPKVRRPEPRSLFEQERGRTTGRDRDDLEPIGVRRQDLQRLRADRAGASEDSDASFHGAASARSAPAAQGWGDPGERSTAEVPAFRCPAGGERG